MELLRWYCFIVMPSIANTSMTFGPYLHFFFKMFLVTHQIFHQQIMFTEKNFVQSFYTLKYGLLIKTPTHLDTEHRINLTLVINDRGT